MHIVGPKIFTEWIDSSTLESKGLEIKTKGGGRKTAKTIINISPDSYTVHEFNSSTKAWCRVLKIPLKISLKEQIKKKKKNSQSTT